MKSKFIRILFTLSTFCAVTVPARAQEVLTLVGTGPDTGISFQLLTPTPITAPGLNSTFGFISCTVPAGETCGTGSAQAAYSGPGGQLRLTTSGAAGKNRTWDFPAYLHAGVYFTPGDVGAGIESGLLYVTGIDATAGNPQSNATGAAFQVPLEATVTNTQPAYPSGTLVTFTAPGSGPSATFAGGVHTATTDSSGRVSLTPTANGTAGAYQITVSANVDGNVMQYAFTLANVNTANAVGACQVTTAADDFSTGSLRYQVAACGKGGTITFASGINPVVQFQDIPLTQDLTIDGGGAVTIQTSNSRVFFIQGGTITLKNLTISGAGTPGGAGGAGNDTGGGGAGMGGAIFQNGGTLNINNVQFLSNTATGGDGGISVGASEGGGGGFGVIGGLGAGVTTAGNGGGGGDFETSGGSGSAATGANGSGSGAGGGGGGTTGGNGGFAAGGGGGGTFGGNGGFGGGGGGGAGPGTQGIFGGIGVSFAGGGGAGLGGAIFVNAGTLSLVNATFTSNQASGGGGQAGNGQGKGGALFINSSATATYSGTAPAFSENSATYAGFNTLCNTVVGAGALDTNDVCGILTSTNATHFQVTAGPTATAGTPASFTVTALNSSNATDTAYTGTVHFTSNDSNAVLAGNYTFVSGDGGVHIFTNGVTFHTSGTRTITTTDTGDSSIAGTSGNITVSPGAVHTITVSAATPQLPGVQFNLTVTLTDQFSNTISSSSDTFHFTSTDGAASLPSNGPIASATVPVTLNTKGSQTIAVTDIATTVIGTSNSISVTAVPATITASFSPATVALGADSILTITVTNSNTIPLTNVTFSDTAPAGLTLVTETAGTCGTVATGGGTTNVSPGTGLFSSTSAQLGAGASCNAMLKFTASAPGSITNNTSTVTSDQSVSAGTAASATLNVTAAPTLSQSFTPSTIQSNASSALGFTVTNTDSTRAATGLAFSDLLPSGMTVASPNVLTGSCGGGTITAAAGSGSVTLSGATLPANGNCTFSVNVVVSSAGIYSNTPGAISSTNEGARAASTATLTALAPPLISKAFGAATIPVNGSTSLSFTISNSNSTTALTGVAFTDSFPAGLTVASPNGLTGSCGGGTITAAAGLGSVTLAGATIAAAGSCTFGLNVIANVAGTYAEATGNVTSSNAGTGNAAIAQLTVIGPPSLSMSFGAASVAVNTPVALSFRIANPNATAALSAIGFTDALPTGLTIANPGGIGGTCDGTISATPGSGSIALSGATLAANSSCNFSVTVLAGSVGSWNNVTSTVSTSVNGLVGSSASASISVTPPLPPPPSNGQVTPAVINLVDYIAGGGTSVLSGAFTVTDTDGKPFTISGGAPWLNIVMNGGAVNVSVNQSAVTNSVFAAVNLTFTFADGTTQAGQVTLHAIAPSQFVNPAGSYSLSFSGAAGSGSQSQTLTIAAAGSPVSAQAAASTVDGANWLSVTGGGTTPQPFTITVNPVGLAPGTYQGSITISSPATGTNPLVIAVTFVVTPGAPDTMAINAIDNAASLLPAAIAPNAILSAFGSFPNCASDAQVTINGAATTVFYSSPTQINFLTPATLTGTSAQLAIACAGLTSAPRAIAVATLTPALFTIAQSGTGQADSVNQDNSVDVAVPLGTVVQLYGTGFGLYNAPAPGNGLTNLAQTVTATVGGVPAQVLFSGQAPGYTPGLQQIDIVVPTDAPPGAGIPVVLTIGGVTTQTGLTLTLQAPSQ